MCRGLREVWEIPCFFVLGASSSCNLLVMWGSRSETMWKAGLSRRNCSTSCGKWKAASAAVLPSGRSSLGSMKPGQGMGSVPGHAAGESPGGSLYKALGLRAPAPLLRQPCRGAGCSEAGNGSGRRVCAVQLSVSSAGGKGDLCSVPLLGASRWTHPVTHSLCPSVPRGCCFWLNRQQLCKDFSVPHNFVC